VRLETINIAPVSLLSMNNVIKYEIKLQETHRSFSHTQREQSLAHFTTHRTHILCISMVGSKKNVTKDGAINFVMSVRLSVCSMQ